MKLMEQSQKIGLEVEFYDRPLYDAIRSGNHSFVKNAEINKIKVAGDASLGEGGLELKFDGGIPINKSFDAVKFISDHIKTSSDVEFQTDSANYLIPKKIKNNHVVNEMHDNYEFGDLSHGGTTGLHIHFEVPENATALDMLALADYTAKKDSEFRKRGWRDSKIWAGHSNMHLSHFSYVLDNAFRGGIYSIELLDKKYMGVNFTNVGRGLNTIEFRYADATLINDISAYKKYLKYCKSAMDKCMIGRENYTFKRKGEAPCSLKIQDGKVIAKRNEKTINMNMYSTIT